MQPSRETSILLYRASRAAPPHPEASLAAALVDFLQCSRLGAAGSTAFRRAFRLGLYRKTRRSVRNSGEGFARHQQAQQRLETVASRLGAAPSSKLSATHLRVQSHFRSIPSGSFDRAFIRHEIGDYRYFLQHFEAASRTGGPLVRQYATSETVNLREDQAKLVALAAGAT